MAKRGIVMWNLRILSPKGKRGREIAYHRRGDARFSKPEEITRLSKLVRQRERERDYTARAIFETRLGLITNQLTRNFLPFDDSRIRNRSSPWRKTGSIGSREREGKRDAERFSFPVFPTIFKIVSLNFWL